MGMPDHFAKAPSITVHDGLAELLGSAESGRIRYEFADAVRLTGHACPTVAGAWLMVHAALRALYPDGPAERGDIEVDMSAYEDEGTTGVIAQVFTLVTGAAASNGFHGIGGHHVRQDLLSFGHAEDDSIATFRRRDNGAAVAVSMDLSTIPSPPHMKPLMMQALAQDATAETRQAFAQVWQDRVRRLLLEHADDPQVIRVQACT